MSSTPATPLHYHRAIWWSVFLLSAIPAARLCWLYSTGQIGANPLQTLIHSTGRWALIFLLLSLAIAPLRQTLTLLCGHLPVRYGRRLEDWNGLIRLRRMLGLYCFLYASLHMLVYIVFDLALDWAWALSDIREKFYITLGVIAYLMLVPVALTSNNRLLNRMGKRNWQRLHNSVHLILVITLLHFWWQSKVGVHDYLPYTAAAIVVLCFRLCNRLGLIGRHLRDDGMEATARQ